MSVAAAPGLRKFEWLLSTATQADAYDRRRASLAETFISRGPPRRAAASWFNTL